MCDVGGGWLGSRHITPAHAPAYPPQLLSFHRIIDGIDGLSNGINRLIHDDTRLISDWGPPSHQLAE